MSAEVATDGWLVPPVEDEPPVVNPEVDSVDCGT